MSSTPVGFDRQVELPWLDATAAAVASGLRPDEVRAHLTQRLRDTLPGSPRNGALGKTKTVLMRVWVLVPDRLTTLRGEGLDLLRDATPRERLAVHWGMCVATHPFFYGVAEIIGRLTQLQGTVTLAELTRRIRELWGDRSTVVRAVPRVVRSMVEWGALHETTRHGMFQPADSSPWAIDGRRGAWLLAAAALGSRETSLPMARLRRSLALYPFRASATSTQIEAFGSLRVEYEGIDREVVRLLG